MKKYLLCLAALTLMVAATASAENMTATGTVVSLTGDTLVVNTANGEKTFILSPGVSRANLAVSSRVNVAYTDDNGKWVASQITPATSSSSLASAATQPEPALESTSPTVTDRTATDNDQLPATASNLPAFLLAGFAALAAALVLRRVS